jgi:hypothetical protein
LSRAGARTKVDLLPEKTRTARVPSERREMSRARARPTRVPSAGRWR